MAKWGLPIFSGMIATGGLLLGFREFARPLIARRSLRSPIPLDEKSATKILKTALLTVTPNNGHGQALLDAERAVDVDQAFFRRVRFATSSALIEDFSRLNVRGYRGTVYGQWWGNGAFKKKLRRNTEIAARNPYAFAALVDEVNPDLYLGLTAILPLTPEGARSYLDYPGIADNDVSGAMVARPGEPFTHVLLFAITQEKLFKRLYSLTYPHSRASDGREGDLEAVSELVRLLIFQMGTIVTKAKAENEFTLFGQTERRSIGRLFEEIGMKFNERMCTADGEPVYSAQMRAENIAPAGAVLNDLVAGKPKLMDTPPATQLGLNLG